MIPPLGVFSGVCLWSRQNLGSWVFGIRVREGFVHRAGRARTSAKYFSAHLRSLRQKRRYRV